MLELTSSTRNLVASVTAILVLTLLATACSPLTPVRRSLYSPRATVPARVGAPLETGELRFVGQINSFDLTYFDNDGEPYMSSRVGDPGVFTPRLQVGAAGYGGLNDYIEVGGQFHYSRLTWARANVIGVLSFPDPADQHLVLFGGGLRFNYPIYEDQITFSLMAELNAGSVSQATFECVHEDCMGSDRTSATAERGTVYYRLDDVSSEIAFFPQLAFQVSGAVFEHLHIFGLFGVQRNVKNIGFDPDMDNKDNSTMEGYLITTGGLGLEVNVRPVVFTAVAFLPLFTEERIPMNPSASLLAGLSF